MNWVIWVIVLIPVAVSILSLLFRPAKEDPVRGGRVRPGPQQGGPRPARRSVSDIDQFLEEINRRRREAAERRGQTPIAAEPASPPREKPAQPPRPVPPPVVTRPSRRIERDRPVPLRPRVRLPERDTVVVAEVAPTSLPQALLPPIETHVASTLEPMRAPVASAPAATPALANLLPLLRTPEGLRTAFLIREILGKPVARRGGRRLV